MGPPCEDRVGLIYPYRALGGPQTSSPATKVYRLAYILPVTEELVLSGRTATSLCDSFPSLSAFLYPILDFFGGCVVLVFLNTRSPQGRARGDFLLSWRLPVFSNRAGAFAPAAEG